MRRLHIVGAALVVGLLGLTGCSAASNSSPSASSSSSKAPFRVLVVTGLTGPTQSASQLALTSFKAAAARLNKTGGVGGRKITIESGDSKGDPTQAVTVLQQLIAGGAKPDLVFAGLSSGETQAMLPVLTRDQILSVGSSNSPALNDPKSYPYHFGFSVTGTGALVTLPAYLKKNKLTKVSALIPQDAFGDGIQTALAANLSSSELTSSTRYNDTATDLTVQWQTAAASKPDVIYADCFGADCAPLLASRAKANVANIPVILGFGATSTGLGPSSFATADALKNVKMIFPSYQAYKSPSQQSAPFAANFKAISPVTSSIVPGALPADELRGVALAYERSKSTNINDVVAQMYKLNEAPSTWVTGWTIKFNSQTHFPVPDPKDYLIEPVGPMIDGMFKVNG
ncbi:MAG: hypothetical protein JWN80_2971 [Microbacteriaceae bacterium]|nr:hypothetical protein [Microbacteriaceae bacterium]